MLFWLAFFSFPVVRIVRIGERRRTLVWNRLSSMPNKALACFRSARFLALSPRALDLGSKTPESSLLLRASCSWQSGRSESFGHRVTARCRCFSASCGLFVSVCSSLFVRRGSIKGYYMRVGHTLLVAPDMSKTFIEFAWSCVKEKEKKSTRLASLTSCTQS